MTYEELLQSDEWKAKRIEILARDKNTCTNCLNESLINNCEIGSIQSRDNFSNSRKTGFYSLLVFTDNQEHILGAVPKNKITYFKEQIVYYKILAENEMATIIAMRIKTREENEREYDASREALSQLNLPEEVILKLLNKSNNKENSSTSFNSINPETLIWKFVNGLHIHHKYYQLERKPWEYPNEALTTLCLHCHEKIHNETKIEVYDAKNNLIKDLIPCSKCSGTGHIPKYDYYYSGICFKCNGDKYENLKLYSN